MIKTKREREKGRRKINSKKISVHAQNIITVHVSPGRTVVIRARNERVAKSRKRTSKVIIDN
jgi:hypothetical protein